MQPPKPGHVSQVITSLGSAILQVTAATTTPSTLTSFDIMARATASSSRSSNDRSSAACKKSLGAFTQAEPFQEAGVEPTVHDRLIKIRDSGDNSGEEREMGDASTGDVGFRMGANDKFIGIESISFGQLVLLLTTANGG